VKLVRKQIASVLAVGLVSVPTSVAAGLETDAVDGHPKLRDQTTLDRHWKRTKRELREKRKQRKATGAPDVAIPPQLEQIAQCESHGDPRAIGGGRYRGKYQFDMSSWASVGGQGDPAAAPEAEQDRRAAILYARSGPSQWPVCGA